MSGAKITSCQGGQKLILRAWLRVDLAGVPGVFQFTSRLSRESDLDDQHSLLGSPLIVNPLENCPSNCPELE